MKNNLFIEYVHKCLVDNIDIIECWFRIENKKLDENELLNCISDNLTLETNDNIYIHINKLFNDYLNGEQDKLKTDDYIMANFKSLFELLTKEFKEMSKNESN